MVTGSLEPTEPTFASSEHATVCEVLANLATVTTALKLEIGDSVVCALQPLAGEADPCCWNKARAQLPMPTSCVTNDTKSPLNRMHCHSLAQASTDAGNNLIGIGPSRPQHAATGP